ASNKQALAIDEVNRGVVEIDKVTQRNAAISEQTAAAAGELSENASRLRGMLSRFKLKGTGGLLPPARSRGALPAAEAKTRPAKAPVMERIKWDPAVYGVGSPEMDEQHKRLFSMISGLFEAERTGKSREAVGKILNGLIDYAVSHFAKEEEYLKRIGYPDLGSHRKKHEELAAQVTRMFNDYSGGDAKSVMKLYGFLTDWLDSHIKKEDKRYGEYALRSGTSAHANAGNESRRTKAGQSYADPNDVISLDDDFSHF
ncbi:MAG: bacteriohemerythrin, partial [Nitrospinae bacterium]|nr:bacteriohemerythrin [Nitrospinota bacterium]